MRKKIYVYGIVQGVGFRPFIYNLAAKHNIKGYVMNTSSGVIIDAEGSDEELAEFMRDIKGNPPSLAVITGIEVGDEAELGYKSFEIRASEDNGGFLPVSPDISICDDCLRELFDKNDRRFRYPFINCTNCGPRYSIIKVVPYDRPNTTMADFAMCERCNSEYTNPADRRFHAQPNACPKCGPRVAWGEDETIIGEEAIRMCECCIKDGDIVAIKGLGGFHLACDAENEAAVTALRQRKKRYEKPFAIMVLDIETAKSIAYVNEAEEQLLLSRRRPIVLLKQRPDCSIAPSVAPGLDTIGIMLPYTPLHYIILSDLKMPLVMTSGNVSDEPIIKGNKAAMKRLSGIADGFLTHNRDIYAAIDDSVFMHEGGDVPIRRARGYAPEPVRIPKLAINKGILSVGGQDKVTVCLQKGGNFFVTQHIGDMDNPLAYAYFKEAIARYEDLFRIKPGIVAFDMHPDYLTARYAQGLSDVVKIAVQHHHAHIASCMAENGLTGEVIGIAYDGTGYGEDGRIWGGEIMTATLDDYKRAAHLKYMPMLGGELAIKKIYRMALSYMLDMGEEFDALIEAVSPKEYDIIKIQWKKRINAPDVSSMGRLFDAAASAIGIKNEVSYEGQAAAMLEAAAEYGSTSAAYDYSIYEENGLDIIDPSAIIKEAYYDRAKGIDVRLIATMFHNSVIRFTAEEAERVRNRTGINEVALSGGVFQNRFILKGVRAALESKGFKVYTHSIVPPNDGGISLGQAAVAAARMKGEI